MANISSYNQLSSWNEDDDLLFVQQPDAPKKAHPSQMKEYILEGLDVESVGGTGKYISEISEADGKINATEETMDDAPTENSNAPVKSGGIKTAIDDVQEQIANRVEIQNNAGFHNSIYRGKCLGTEVTQEQWNAISAGTFDDMYIGDYWTIGGVIWRIAHFNYWLNTGDTECTTHHVVIVPDTNLYNAKMNDSNTTTGAYVGSAMYTTNLEQAKTIINNAFGASHILSHREFLTNAVSNGDASGWAWYDSTVDLMSEVMVYGTLAWSVGGKGYEVGIDKEQLALFRLDHSRICNRANWWLRGVVSDRYFVFVYDLGVATYNVAAGLLGVRPAFGIKA